EAESILRAAPRQPIAGRRSPQHLVGHWRQALGGVGRLRPWRQRDAQRERTARRTAYPGKLHPQRPDRLVIGRKRDLARRVPVLLQELRYEIRVLLVRQDASLSWRHR